MALFEVSLIFSACSKFKICGGISVSSLGIPLKNTLESRTWRVYALLKIDNSFNSISTYPIPPTDNNSGLSNSRFILISCAECMTTFGSNPNLDASPSISLNSKFLFCFFSVKLAVYVVPSSNEIEVIPNVLLYSF